MTPTPDNLIQPEDELNNEELGDELDLDEGEDSLLDEIAEPGEWVDASVADETDLGELEEMEAEDEEDDTQIGLATDLGDDPVRMYLKEIGQVRLLDNLQEIWLAIQMSAASYLAQL